MIHAQNAQQIDTCKVCYKVDCIPKEIFKAINDKYAIYLKLANPTEEYQATDIKENDKLLDRQLRYLIQTDSIYILCYLRGGRGIHECCLIINAKNMEKIQNVELLKFRCTPKELIEAIKKHAYDEVGYNNGL